MSIYAEEHEEFRELFRGLLKQHATPFVQEWTNNGYIPREFYETLAEYAVLGHHIPEEYGGGGVDSFRFNAILVEEAARQILPLGSLRVHMAVVVPYLLKYATDEQKQRWLPDISEGRLLTSICLTEPGAGSDLGSIRTRAVEDGDDYVLTGSKIFITGGHQADYGLVACRTDSVHGSVEDRNHMSLLFVDLNSEGVQRGQMQGKIGLHMQDTVELFFDGVRVPKSNIIGELGEGLELLKANLSQERLIIAIGAIAGSERAIELAIQYANERELFGRKLGALQNTRFVLADAIAKVAAGRALLDESILAHEEGRLSQVDAAKIKLFATELQSEVTDDCLQLFGGYGYTTDFPISQLFVDARVARIYGGSSEVMRAIIGSAALRESK